MISLIEEVPTRLARWAESCPCHVALIERLPKRSTYYVSKLVQKHYGEHYKSCPLAGMLAPEIVGGKLVAVAEEIWHVQEMELHCFPVIAQAESLTPAEWQTIIGDFWKGKSVSMTLLKLKTQFYHTLPWKLMGVAHWHEDTARQHCPIMPC